MGVLFTQHLRNGEYLGGQKKRVCEYIGKLVTSDKVEFTITITPFQRSKSSQQLGYYWGVVIPEMMRFQGCSSVEADQVLKTELVPPEVRVIMDITIEVRASIAKMKIREMAEYIDLCINFLGTWGVAVPPPPYKEC